MGSNEIKMNDPEYYAKLKDRLWEEYEVRDVIDAKVSPMHSRDCVRFKNSAVQTKNANTQFLSDSVGVR